MARVVSGDHYAISEHNSADDGASSLALTPMGGVNQSPKHRVTIPYKWSFEKWHFSFAFHKLFTKTRNAFHENHEKRKTNL